MALVVLLLLMTVLFRSLRDSLIVLLTVPLALVGGVLGLRLLDLVSFQALDLLSMIGFVMMIGVIINHAILLVAAVRSVESEGAALEEGIRAGLQQRLRAILASTLTGALGALPMAVNPGPGQRHLPRPGGGQHRRRRGQPRLQPGADPGAHAPACTAAAARHRAGRRPGCRPAVAT